LDLRQLELHDAVLLGVTMDVRLGAVEVRLAYYADTQSRERVAGTLRFAGVSRINQLVDLEQLKDDAGAGNISYWVTGESARASYIYLSSGLIEVVAKSVELVPS
jgi:hypothetical protein